MRLTCAISVNQIISQNWLQDNFDGSSIITGSCVLGLFMFPYPNYLSDWYCLIYFLFSSLFWWKFVPLYNSLALSILAERMREPEIIFIFFQSHFTAHSSTTYWHILEIIMLKLLIKITIFTLCCANKDVG